MSQHSNVTAKVANPEDPSRVLWDAGGMSGVAEDLAHSLCERGGNGYRLLRLLAAVGHHGARL